jgi:predicted ribosome quality control (RQC) complex YloA/Tae2 family protein
MVAELTGKKSNLILTDESNKILFVMGKKGEDERLSVGNSYTMPTVYIHKSEKEEPKYFLEKRESGEDDFTFNKKAESYYLKKEAALHTDNRRIALSVFLRKKVKKLEEKKRKLEQELAQFNRNELFLEHGELLKQNLGIIKKGASEVILCDSGNQDKKITIKLDPSISAVENMKLFFGKYKKALRGKTKIQIPLVETTEEILKCRKRIDEIEKASPEELEKLAPAEHIDAKISKKDKSGKLVSTPHQFLSADNVKILVGKNSSQNDEVTFRYAKGNDLWLHAQEAQGGHVILCLDKRSEIPDQTLLDGATLAVYYSGLKSEGKGNVIYTRKKYVKKPKGAKPGLVTYSQEKIFFVRLEPERVTRLMSGKN